MSYPAGMAFDRAGGLYIADSGNHAVRKIYADGTIGTVLGRSAGTTLYAPLAVAVDPAGTLYVGDSTFAVRAFTAAGKWTGYAGTGVPGFSGDGGSAINAALSTVNDLTTDVSGNLWIADGVRVRRVDPAGRHHHDAGRQRDGGTGRRGWRPRRQRAPQYSNGCCHGFRR
jgi:sugar lactone lactonase YvrE